MSRGSPECELLVKGEITSEEWQKSLSEVAGEVNNFRTNGIWVWQCQHSK